MRYILTLITLLGIQQFISAQQTGTTQLQLLSNAALVSAKVLKPLPTQVHLPKEFQKDEKKAKGLLIGGCVSMGVCAGLVIAGTTLATQPIGAYTEGIAFIGAGLGAGIVSIPLIVLSKKYQP